MYWIFLPSFIIWVFYFGFKLSSDSFFDEAHGFDHINLFGFEMELQSYISDVEWFYFFVLFELFKFTLLTLLSPFNAFVSEIYDQKLTGNQFKFFFTRMLKDIVRGLIITITGFSLELFLGGFWLLLALIFPLESLTPLFFLAISSFFFGFAYLDYSLERHRFDVFKSWRFAFKNGKTCFAIGLLFSLLMLIPIAGIIIAPPIITIFASHHFLKIKT